MNASPLIAPPPEPRSSPTLFAFAPVLPSNGFRMKDYWIWCPSVIQGLDHRYHMFASRWPKWLPFHPGWMTNSEVVRAVADRPEGPYTFAEVVLPPRGAEYWDGRSTHNPTIRFHAGRYYLYYTGITHPLKPLEPGEPFDTKDPRCIVARSCKRVGLAWADSITGPWHRLDHPILQTAPNTFYSFLTSNPAPVISENGQVTLLFKSRRYLRSTHSGMMIGLATAPHPEGPYKVLGDEPLFSSAKFGEIEDPFLWKEEGLFRMIAKDMSGRICGQAGGGLYAESTDARTWRITRPMLAYRKEIHWTDHGIRTYGSLERPFLLMENGRITHLCAAASNGTQNFVDATETWNAVLPVAALNSSFM